METLFDMAQRAVWFMKSFPTHKIPHAAKKKKAKFAAGDSAHVLKSWCRIQKIVYPYEIATAV